jgi:hypothetical protein
VPIPPAQHKDDREWGDNKQKDEPPLRSTNADIDGDMAVQKAIVLKLKNLKPESPPFTPTFT